MEKESVIEEFSSIEGVDEKIALKLLNAGIKSVSDLEAQDPQNLSDKIGYPPRIVRKWIDSATRIKQDKKFNESEKIILNLQNSLNCSYEDAKNLRNVGIFNLKDLIKENPIQLADDAGINSKYVRLWIKKAKKILKTKKNT